MRTDAPLTGRQVHGLISDEYSLWTVQVALKALTQIGIVNTEIVGRAGLHTINEAHVSVGPLRSLLDPLAELATTVAETAGDSVEAVILFGSIARGEATPTSDIDLAVIASARWDGRTEMEDAIRARLGNDCDVLTFTRAAFRRGALNGEPVVSDILSDGVALIGSMPRVKSGAA
jgi:predicted nucleotidyltransferase